MNIKSPGMFASRTKGAKNQPKMKIVKKIAGKSHPCDLMHIPKEEFERIEIDPINPRHQKSLTYESEENSFVKSLREFGQITEAVARYKLDENGDLVYKKIKLPNGEEVERSIISVIDGSRRFDGGKKGDLSEYSVAVGKFSDEVAEIIMTSSFDSQRELSCLELAVYIDTMERNDGVEYSPTELVEKLPFKKDRSTISIAKKALQLMKSHPRIFNVFPSQPLVGKTTIKQLEKIILHVGATFSDKKRKAFFQYIDELSEDRSYWEVNKIITDGDGAKVTSKMYTKILSQIADKANFKKPSNENKFTEVGANVSYLIDDIGMGDNDKPVVKANILIEMISKDDSELLVKLSSLLSDDGVEDSVRAQLKQLVS